MNSFRLEGGNSIPRGQIISYLKTSKIISKGCLYHIVRVKDLVHEAPPLELVPILKDFSEVFPDDYPGISPKLEIDFGMELMSDI